jgi:hypothetical protein
MSTAFEITSEDVRNVMELNGHSVDEAAAEKIFQDVIAPEDGRIEKAALYGNEIERSRQSTPTRKLPKSSERRES